jgi:hypothetical protein
MLVAGADRDPARAATFVVREFRAKQDARPRRRDARAVTTAGLELVPVSTQSRLV